MNVSIIVRRNRYLVGTRGTVLQLDPAAIYVPVPDARDLSLFLCTESRRRDRHDGLAPALGGLPFAGGLLGGAFPVTAEPPGRSSSLLVAKLARL